MSGLKNIGNSILGYFGMSLDNFQLNQNQNGSYNITMKQWRSCCGNLSIYIRLLIYSDIIIVFKTIAPAAPDHLLIGMGLRSME